ncbi:Hypothetical_protein [Hexamita inflata]|uniref:Hypothetical_protein n=1 Tax=Hexamita inflata TaxID=28002 RepID=A0AA86PZK5_9EUKA|nr:Hypothetical protein HINF_LOCUS31387 [Hexamita inflata]
MKRNSPGSSKSFISSSLRNPNVQDQFSVVWNAVSHLSHLNNLVGNVKFIYSQTQNLTWYLHNCALIFYWNVRFLQLYISRCLRFTISLFLLINMLWCENNNSNQYQITEIYRNIHLYSHKNKGQASSNHWDNMRSGTAVLIYYEQLIRCSRLFLPLVAPVIISSVVTVEYYQCMDYCSYPARCVQMDDNYCISAIEQPSDAPKRNTLKIALGVGLGSAALVTIILLILCCGLRKYKPTYISHRLLYQMGGQVPVIVTSQMTQPVQTNLKTTNEMNKTVTVMNGAVLEQANQSGAKNDVSIPFMPVL